MHWGERVLIMRGVLPVDIYQPLNAQHGKMIPPQSKSILETAGDLMGINYFESLKFSGLSNSLQPPFYGFQLTRHSVPLQIHFSKPLEPEKGKEIEIKLIIMTVLGTTRNFCWGFNWAHRIHHSNVIFDGHIMAMSTYSGCMRRTSRTKSSGYSNNSGLQCVEETESIQIKV